MEDKIQIGWECPRCGVINSPENKQCKCNKPTNESTEQPKPTLLIE